MITMFQPDQTSLCLNYLSSLLSQSGSERSWTIAPVSLVNAYMAKRQFIFFFFSTRRFFFHRQGEGLCCRVAILLQGGGQGYGYIACSSLRSGNRSTGSNGTVIRAPGNKCALVSGCRQGHIFRYAAGVIARSIADGYCRCLRLIEYHS